MLKYIIRWSVAHKLPADAHPSLGPDATGVGWVMQYILTDTSGHLNLAQLRGLQDFTVRPALTAVPGVAEVASFGGFEKEYQVVVDPAKLLGFGISIQRVIAAVRASIRTSGDVCWRWVARNTSCVVADASRTWMTFGTFPTEWT